VVVVLGLVVVVVLGLGVWGGVLVWGWLVGVVGVLGVGGLLLGLGVFVVVVLVADVAQGLTRGEAIVEATVRRARPVVLTAAAAILAMIPLSRSAFWGPMAITIMGGLFVATFLTLLYLPGLYALWFRKSLNERGGEAAQAEPLPHETQLAFPLAQAAE
jgi:multidrug efflux pump subunit AcrB